MLGPTIATTAGRHPPARPRGAATPAGELPSSFDRARLVESGGGYAIVSADTAIGAIGVGVSPSAQRERQCCQAGLAAIRGGCGALMDESVYRVGIRIADERGYWTSVPALPGAGSQGETIDEAIDPK